MLAHDVQQRHEQCGKKHRGKAKDQVGLAAADDENAEQGKIEGRMKVDRLCARYVDAVAQDIAKISLGAMQTQALIPPDAFGIQAPHAQDK
jgi:uncharacterized protein YjbJ (UPF0337 family)